MIFRRKHEGPNREALYDSLAARSGKVQPEAPAGTAAAATPAPPPARSRPPSREKRRSMTVWLDEAAIQELKRLALEEKKSQQQLVADALNLLFSAYGKQPIAK
jgi:hypothetical protein